MNGLGQNLRLTNLLLPRKILTVESYALKLSNQ